MPLSIDPMKVLLDLPAWSRGQKHGACLSDRGRGYYHVRRRTCTRRAYTKMSQLLGESREHENRGRQKRTKSMGYLTKEEECDQRYQVATGGGDPRFPLC